MSFFEEHQKILENHYPGITEKILQDKLRNFDLDLIKEDLLSGRPLEYITNSKYFFNRDFYVDERVLIPRNETETLVEKALEVIREKDSILDICCGSGNIGLAILEEKKVDLILADLSEEALSVTQKNLKGNKAQLIQSDLYQNIKGHFDVIVSNPPYISTISKGGVHDQVDQFEPHLALYINEDQYDDWFEGFFQKTYSHLKTGGYFFMEGHEDKLYYQQQQLVDLGFKNVEILKDLTRRDRFLRGSK